MPGALRLPPSFAFAGRGRELATLRALLPRTDGEGRRVALVAGEPGSGKSRLVREAALVAAGDGATVLYGACDAVVRAPYGPFVPALEQLVRRVAPAELPGLLGSSAGELRRLLPGLSDLVGELPPPLQADVDTERHRLHTAVTEILVTSGGRAPVMLVLEDVHWADMPTLFLLRHLVRAGTEARMLVVVTFRDAESDLPAEVGDALVDLQRSEGVARLRLGGLSGEEVAQFVRLATGADATPALADTIGALTAGNPFLVTELWRELVDTGALEVEATGVRLARPVAELGTPETVRHVVSQRLARLDADTARLLELAAVSGAELELDVLRRTGVLTEPLLLDAVDAAVRAGLLEEVAGRRGLSYRFAHELVRRAVTDRLSAPRRAELHLRIAEAIEQSPAVRDERARLAALAHHFTEAVPVGGPDRAVAYNLRAASSAADALAFQEAASRLRTALDLGIDEPLRRAEAQLALGSELYRAGSSLEALAAFREAAAVARELRDGDLLARSAIGFESACWRPGLADQGAVLLVEEAAALLDPVDSPLRVRVLGSLARAHDELHGNHERGDAVRRSAIEMARRIDDREGLAAVLVGSYWSDRPRDEVIGLLHEARELAIELGDVGLEAEATEWRIAALMTQGEMEAASRELVVVREMARSTGQPFILHVAEHYRSALALAGGRLDEAEDAAERSREWGRLLTGRDASGVYGIQMFGVRREQGRLRELAPLVRLLADETRGATAWRPGYIALLAELEMVEAARAELADIRRDGLERFRESLWLASLTYLADACSAVADAGTAELLYAELAPFSGANVMVGHGVACYGAADRYLGMLAATAGDEELAQRHFVEAREGNRKMSSTTWVAHTAYEHGRVLARRGETEGARVLLAEAAGLAEEVGLPALLSRVRRLGLSPRDTSGPDDLSARELDVLRLVARGLSNREVGLELHLSEHTVANHVRAILRKTGCANRTEAAGYAHRHGLVPH